MEAGKKRKDAPLGNDRTEVKKSKTNPNVSALLSQLEELLKAHRKALPKEVNIISANITCKDQMRLVKEALDSQGFIIMQNAISPASVNTAKKNIGKCITEMWNEPLQSCPFIIEELLKGNLDAFEPLRNSSIGHGNTSFGCYLKQFLPTDTYPSLQIEGEQIYFDHNACYAGVNLPLLSHPDNLHSLAIMLGLTHPDGMISWDSVKYASNPKPKPKKMTKQILTQMHIDHYPIEVDRYQVVDNVDGAIKLFFVPGSHTPEAHRLISEIAGKQLFKSYGFKPVHNIHPKLRDLFCKYGCAPPPFARIIWKSGIIHFEGSSPSVPQIDGILSGCFPCIGLNDVFNSPRLRFYVGTQSVQKLSEESRVCLAIAAFRGLCPAVYGKINANTKVGDNIVNRKTTQYKVTRTCAPVELQELHDKLNGLNKPEGGELVIEKLREIVQAEIPSELLQLLAGIPSTTLLKDMPFAQFLWE